MEMVKENSTELVALAESIGIKGSKKDGIIQEFSAFETIANEWSDKAFALIVTDESQEEEMKAAREGRLLLRSKRGEIEKKRKELKEASLLEGRLIDGAANFLKGLIEPIEEHLLVQETFAKRKEDERKEARKSERIQLLEVYSADWSVYDLVEMEESKFQEVLQNAKFIHEMKVDNERKEKIRLENEERERIAAEKKAREERDREMEARRKAEEEERARREKEMAAQREAIEKERAELEKKRVLDEKEAAERRKVEEEKRRVEEKKRQKVLQEMREREAKLKAAEEERIKREEELKKAEEARKNLPGIKDEEFVALMSLVMSADPSPVSSEEDDLIVAFLDRESVRRGFDNWITAYHEFKVA